MRSKCLIIAWRAHGMVGNDAVQTLSLSLALSVFGRERSFEITSPKYGGCPKDIANNETPKHIEGRNSTSTFTRACGWSCNMAMGQNPHHTPSEHPNPTTKVGSKMGKAREAP